MIRNAKVYIGFLLVLVFILVDASIDRNYLVIGFTIVGILLITYQLRVNEDVRIVIVKNQINRKYRTKNIKDYYVIILEIPNLSSYSQYYNIRLSDYLISQSLLALKKRLNHGVFLYSSNQILVIQEFEHKTVINQKQRTDEQYEKTTRIIHFLTNQKFYFDQHKEYYQVSVIAGTGSCGIREKYNTIEDLIKLAHFSMLQAQERHQTIHVSTEETRLIKEDVDIFNLELEQGLMYDQMVPYFLPIIHPKTMRVVGCESLLRWEQSDYRIIEASKFKRVAEEKNMFEALDYRIIEKTFQAYQTWKEKDLIDDDFSITINLGLKTLTSINVQELHTLATRYHISPHLIDIDISEQDMAHEAIAAIVSRLHDSGFNVAIDAFQTSNHLLELLTKIKVDTIKIDKSLMPEGVDDTDKYRFYRLIVRLSKMLGYKVMAKGVEHKKHLDLAKQLQVDYIQGYYITPPLNDLRIRGFLNKYHRSVLE
jgi:EAL domain-containing protein (putative c-di-GMP-specific phosphodiesterase class I)